MTSAVFGGLPFLPTPAAPQNHALTLSRRATGSVTEQLGRKLSQNRFAFDTEFS